MAGSERGYSPESSTSALDVLRAERKARTHRLLSGSLKNIGAATLLTVGAGITTGLGAPLVGLGLFITGAAVGTYGVFKGLAGIGNGILNAFRG